LPATLWAMYSAISPSDISPHFGRAGVGLTAGRRCRDSRTGLVGPGVLSERVERRLRGIRARLLSGERRLQDRHAIPLGELEALLRRPAVEVGLELLLALGDTLRLPVRFDLLTPRLLLGDLLLELRDTRVDARLGPSCAGSSNSNCTPCLAPSS
jgi:hypothetical protein